MGGTPGNTYQILVSTDLMNWSLLEVVTATPEGLIEILDADAQNFPFRFYRALMQ
jgi:hypothetical protein